MLHGVWAQRRSGWAEARLPRDGLKCGQGALNCDPGGLAPRNNHICLSGSEPYDFLDVYRMDREIRRDTKGMSAEQKTAYLKAYTGWTDMDDTAPQPFYQVNEDEEPFAPL